MVTVGRQLDAVLARLSRLLGGNHVLPMVMVDCQPDPVLASLKEAVR